MRPNPWRLSYFHRRRTPFPPSPPRLRQNNVDTVTVDGPAASCPWAQGEDGHPVFKFRCAYHTCDTCSSKGGSKHQHLYK